MVSIDGEKIETFQVTRNQKGVCFEGVFTKKEIELWYPKGMGEPVLHDFIFELFNQDKKIYTEEKKIGLRTVEIVRKNDGEGETFIFQINGRPVFVKGANWIPADNVLSWLGDNDYDKLIERAYDATSLNLPTGCDVLILPETPYQYLGSSLKAAINDFAEGGGKIFATGQSALDIGETDNPLGVEVDDMETVGGTTGGKYPIKNACRNIVISKIYKDGIDNPATAVDENLNGTFDASEANTEPTEIDNWEEAFITTSPI